MISDTLRLELQLRQKDDEINNKELEKESKIRELEKRLENTDKMLQVVLSKLED